MRLKSLKEHMLEKEYYEIAWAQSEARYEAVLLGLRAQAHMDLAVNPNLQRSDALLHRKKTELIAQLRQISSESQTVVIAASQSQDDVAQVISYKQSGQETAVDQYPEETVSVADTSTAK